MEFLTEAQRRTVLNNIIKVIDAKFMGAEVDASKLRQEHEAAIVRSETAETFEQGIDTLWVSNSSPSGGDWKLDEVVAVGDPPYPAEIPRRYLAIVGEGQRRAPVQ